VDVDRKSHHLADSIQRYSVQVHPGGETAPLDFSVGEYAFYQDRDNRSVKLKGLRTSKAWVDGILEKTYPDGIFPVNLP